jgi:hypothetical protein
MAEITESAAAIRFLGDELDPDEISRRLGCSPTSSTLRGGVFFTPKGSPLIARTGSWCLNTERLSPGDLDEQIAQLLARLTDDIEVWRDLTARYRGEVFAGLFMQASNEGIGLSADTLLALGTRGLSIDFDVYHLGDEQPLQEALFPPATS